MDDRTCSCGASLDGKRPDAKWCSSACANRAWRRRTDAERSVRTVCDGCGGSIEGKRWQARYCSKNCASLHWYYRTKRGAERPDRECPLCAGPIPAENHANRVFCSIPCREAFRRVTEHGLTLTQYHAMLTSQNGRCLICGVDESGLWHGRAIRRDGWHIDHDHETGAVRGILCPPCNLMIGYAKDRPDVLVAAAQYLRRTVE